MFSNLKCANFCCYFVVVVVAVVTAQNHHWVKDGRRKKTIKMHKYLWLWNKYRKIGWICQCFVIAIVWFECLIVWNIKIVIKFFFIFCEHWSRSIIFGKVTEISLYILHCINSFYVLPSHSLAHVLFFMYLQNFYFNSLFLLLILIFSFI